MDKFRKLKPNEIELRIGTAKESGVSLLLYKDARCDMNILDETVGAENWQRHHSRDNANCIVSIYDEAKKQWVEKEDTGTESFTEKEKGLASDSFKRACFNWGIGRELYTSPFIWISKDKCTIYDTGKKDKFNNPIYSCRDSFQVIEITYSEYGEIDKLVIGNQKTNETVFGSKKTQEPQKPKPTKTQQVVEALKGTTLKNEDVTTWIMQKLGKQVKVEELETATFKELLNYIEKKQIIEEREI